MNDETAQNTLAEELGLDDVDVHELYDAIDWLLKRQNRIENKLAKKHLKGGLLVLFDVSSSYYSGKNQAFVKTDTVEIIAPTDRRLCTVCYVMRKAVRSRLKCCPVTRPIRMRSAISSSESVNALASNA